VRIEQEVSRTREEVERVGRGVYLLSQSQRNLNEEIGALPRSWRRFVEEAGAQPPAEDHRAQVLARLMPLKDTFLAAHRQQSWQDAASRSLFAALEGRLDQTIADLGASPLARPGMAFDARSHMAVLASHGPAPAGTVIAVLRQGYVLGEHVVRLAEVEVCRGPQLEADAPPAADGEEDRVKSQGGHDRQGESEED
jgi:molecular chaperone GrpE